MEVLYDLIHNMAKEEKRLYNLHGRKGRFKAIYEAYAGAKHYSRDLDKTIYSGEFTGLSRAFYSMQKNDLLQDILFVLFEFSNSSDHTYNLIRNRTRAEILKRRGFPSDALNFFKQALEAAKASGDETETLRLLEDILSVYPETQDADWVTYQKIRKEYESFRNQQGTTSGLATDLMVLIKTAKNQPSSAVAFKEIAEDLVKKIHDEAGESGNPKALFSAFVAEKTFADAFESKAELHARLAKLEKRFNTDNYSTTLRFQSIVSLMESAMNVGDFLLMNAVIYKTRGIVRTFPIEDKKRYLPTYLVLAGTFHFYENELTTAMEEFREIIAHDSITAQERISAYLHLASSEHTANLSRQAMETLRKLSGEFPHAADLIAYRLLELMVSVETETREQALSVCQKFRTYLRKQPNPRALLPYRNFVELVRKFLEKKSFKLQPIAGLDPGWQELHRPNLWLKAKIEGSFYYNYILDFWQTRKKVMKV